MLIDITNFFKQISEKTTDLQEATQYLLKECFKQALLKYPSALDDPKKEGIIDYVIESMSTTSIITRKNVWKLYYTNTLNSTYSVSIDKKKEYTVVDNIAIRLLRKENDFFIGKVIGSFNKVKNIKFEIIEIDYEFKIKIPKDDPILSKITKIQNELNPDVAEQLKGLDYVYFHPKIWINEDEIEISFDKRYAKINNKKRVKMGKLSKIIGGKNESK